MNSIHGADLFLFGQECVFRWIAHCEQTSEFVIFGSTHDSLYLAGFVSHRNMEHGSQTFRSGGKQNVLQRAPCRSEVVERALLRRCEQWPCQLAKERDDEQSALHEHLLLFGQCVGEHRHFVLVAGLVHFGNEFLELLHVLCERRNYLRYVFAAAHHDELELAQMVVGRSLESCRQNLFQHFVRDFPVGKVADGSSFLQYFVEIHNNTFLGDT